MMDDYRKDSLYLDFSGMPVRPKLDTVYELISKKINLDMTKVNCIQPSMTKARVIIELKAQSYVEELVAEHSSKHTVEHNNKHYAIPLVPYDNTVEVRVSDLPSYVSTETVIKHLASYGEVVSTRDEVWKNFWPGLSTGVRLVRMRIQKPIPSFIPMTTHTAYISHRNQIRTCRYCVRPLHIGRTCNDARRELGIDINSRLTAAQVVQGNILPPQSLPNTDDPSSSSSLPNTSAEMETPGIESNSSKAKPLAETATDCVTATAGIQTRSSSTTRHPPGKLQAARTSRTSSPATIKTVVTRSTSHPNTTEFEISDDADEEMANPGSSKRHRSPVNLETNETPFVEVKRKSRSSSKHNSSSR